MPPLHAASGSGPRRSHCCFVYCNLRPLRAAAAPKVLVELASRAGGWRRGRRVPRCTGLRHDSCQFIVPGKHSALPLPAVPPASQLPPRRVARRLAIQRLDTFAQHPACR